MGAAMDSIVNPQGGFSHELRCCLGNTDVKRRIEQLLNGKFEYEVLPPVFSVRNIRQKLKQGELLTGAFEVTAPEGKRMRGFLYSSNTRVKFDPPEFTGTQSRIIYQVDPAGMHPGDTVDGVFTLCTDLGEYQIPYQFEIESTAAAVKPRSVSLPQLLELAKADPLEARARFMDPDYGTFLEEEDPLHSLLYRSLTKGSRLRPRETALAAERTAGRRGQSVQSQTDLSAGDPAARALEEYLIGAAGKETIELSLDESFLEMDAPERSVSHTVLLHRSTWGHMEISIRSDASFLRPEKRQISTDDFVGETWPLEFIIDKNFLHAGRNYGRIEISSCYQTIYLEVQVNAQVRSGELWREERVQKIMRSKLLGLYEDLRLGKIEMQAWIDRSVNVLSSYRRSGGRDTFSDLFLVQLYFADNKRIKGYRLLQELEQNPGRFQTQEQYGFYLYLSTFYERDAEYMDQVEARIAEMLRRQPDSWILQWTLLYLQDRYLKNDEARLDVIRTQVNYGCASPVMYLEAAIIFRKNPYILRRLDLFEKKILLYMLKQKMMTDELASHVGNLAVQNEAFESKLLRILTGCYEALGSRDCLKALCIILIAADKRDPVYFHWYAQAVQADLRITGLYEYYMETMDTVGIEKMPQIIRMYFSYDNSLNYHKKAAIYRDISDNRENVPQVYRSSRPQIQQFVIQQLSLGRIDRNLAVLYERFLTRRILTRSLADNLARLLFSFEITCKNPRMKSVVIVHDHLKHEQEVPLVGGFARVQIYHENARILLTDEEGRRYASPSLYMAERCLDAPLLITYCRELVPDHPMLTLYFTGRREAVTSVTLPYYKRAAERSELTDSFRMTCRRKVLDYYIANPLEEDLYSWLKGIRREEYAEAGKEQLEELLAREGLYEEAFALLEIYGSEDVAPPVLVRICSQLVLSREYDEDETLLAFCHECYANGKYDDNILTYLLMYYDGPVEEMKRLWNTGSSNDMDTLTLEEKILSLLLFTRMGTAGTEPIFVSYEKHLGRRKICKAYDILKCYEYLVKNLPVSDTLFRYLERCIDRGDEMEDVELLALLQHYAGMENLGGRRARLSEKLLDDFCERGMRFAFYLKFPHKLIRASQTDDRVFMEYVADPSHRVVLYYRRKGQDEYQKEVMNNIFEGIFVREFIIFDTEEMDCYTEEYDASGTLIKTSGHRILTSQQSDERDTSRYAQLGRMSRKAVEGESGRQALMKDLESYIQLDYLTEKLFTLV